MQAVIMAGGQGTRLRELTKDLIPKPMIEICGRPLLQWQIENLKENGINDIIVVVGHLSERIVTNNDLDKFNNIVSYYIEDKPLGTAGALLQIKDILEDEFFLIYGDLFFNIDFQKMIDFHHSHGGTGTLFVHPNSHPYDSDLVDYENDYRITKIYFKDNKPTKWLHNCTTAGIYLFNKRILEVFPYRHKIDLEKDILPNLWYCYAYKSSEYVKDIGTVDRYYQVANDIINNIPFHRNLKKKQKAIFLDRDGTINEEVGLVSHPAQLNLLPNAAAAIRLINDSEYLAIVVTNQSVVARGMCSIEDVNDIHAKMETLLGQEGAYLNDIFFCPHHQDRGYPDENKEYKIDCDCRKPKPGLIYKAAERYNIDLSQSWIIGDSPKDEMAGINAGVKPILIPRDANNLLEAVRKIL